MSASLAIAFIFCVIIGRFFYIQAVWGSELVMLASDQWNREIPVIAARGTIYDRNGAVLAGNDMLCTGNYAQQYDAVLEAVRSGVISEERIDSSVRRILTWKSHMSLI